MRDPIHRSAKPGKLGINGIRGDSMSTRRILLVAFAAAGLLGGAATARADDFELAMVIKETTNPYYNATLAGARIAAGEIGGKANNYGAKPSSRPAAGHSN